MNRRSFLRSLAGIGAVALAPAIPLIPALGRPVEALRRYSTLSEIVSETLRKNAHLIADNVAMNNAFLKRLRERSTQPPQA